MIPSKESTNIKELALYIWKSLDLPVIAKEDLIYDISFELFLFKPNKTIQLVNELIKKGFFIIEDGTLSLSEDLRKNFSIWQKKENTKVKNALKEINKRKNSQKELTKQSQGLFNNFLKELSNEKSLNRTTLISRESFTFRELNFDQGIIKGEVSGSKEEPYKFEIDLKKKKITHDCHDFVTRKRRQKMFCKHLLKLFLILKTKNELKATKILKSIIKDIKFWEFS